MTPRMDLGWRGLGLAEAGASGGRGQREIGGATKLYWSGRPGGLVGGRRLRFLLSRIAAAGGLTYFMPVDPAMPV